MQAFFPTAFNSKGLQVGGSHSQTWQDSAQSKAHKTLQHFAKMQTAFSNLPAQEAAVETKNVCPQDLLHAYNQQD